MSGFEDRATVAHQVLALLDERFGEAYGPLNEEVSLVDLGLDSVDVLDTLASLERHFSIVFEQDDLGDLERLGDLVDLVCGKLGLEAGA